MLPKLTIEQSITILRQRFPGSLVCVRCARLIASTPAGYAKSNVTPEQAQSYVCFECRQDEIDAQTEALARERKADAARATLARVRARKANELIEQPAEIPLDAVIRYPGVYAQEELVALARHYAATAPRRLTRRTRFVRVPSVADKMPARGWKRAVTPPSLWPPDVQNTQPGGSVDSTSLRAGSMREYRTESGGISRLRGRRLRRVRTRTTSPAQLEALARINAARKQARGSEAA